MSTLITMAMKQMTKGDAFVLIVALVLMVIFYSVFWRASSHTGEFIHIVSAGNAIEKTSLFQNREITINGPLGDSRLQIEGGRVRFISSPCSSKLCVHQGWASLSGEFIACLPNRISVSIEGQNNQYDTVNF